MLIEVSDLPVDWTEVQSDNHPTEVPGAEDIEATLVSAFFQASDLGPFLGHMLLFAENESDARTAYAAVEEELEDPTILDGISEEVRSWETEPIPFETYGDDTFAFRALGDTGSLPVVADLVTVRQGRYVTLVIFAQVMGVDSEQTERAVEMAMEKLP